MLYLVLYILLVFFRACLFPVFAKDQASAARAARSVRGHFHPVLGVADDTPVQQGHREIKLPAEDGCAGHDDPGAVPICCQSSHEIRRYATLSTTIVYAFESTLTSLRLSVEYGPCNVMRCLQAALLAIFRLLHAGSSAFWLPCCGPCRRIK